MQSYSETYQPMCVSGLQMQSLDISRALEAALAIEDFAEAEALQEEYDAVVQKAASLAAAHDFHVTDDFPEAAETPRQAREEGLPGSARASVASADSANHLSR